jgi:hypothetical protein
MVDTVFHCTTGNEIDVLLNNLQCVGINKDSDLIYTAPGEGMVSIATIITINTIVKILLYLLLIIKFSLIKIYLLIYIL